MSIEKWLKNNTSSLSGKTVAVTGSTGGLGAPLCAYLAQLGASLILVDRNKSRSEAHASELREKYGNKLYFKGGIDKHALRKGKEAIRKELEYKMSAPMLGGGTVFALDHLVPNGVKIEDFRYYVNLSREILGLGPIKGEGFERMAF